MFCRSLTKIFSRNFAENWEREFRRKGLEFVSSFAMDYTAREKKHLIKKMREEIGDLPPKKEIKPIEIKKIDDIPYIDFARETLKYLIPKIEKECGPLKYKVEESPDGNPFNNRIKINHEGYKRLWNEIMKDELNLIKVIKPLEMALQLGMNLLAEQKNLKIPDKFMEEAKKEASTQLPDAKPQPAPSPDSLKIAAKVKFYESEFEKTRITFDLHRLDIGLIINRPPIFLQYFYRK